MPNGNANFESHELRDIENFFEPIAYILTSFAQQHNLKLRKYYHHVPCWDFTFRHLQQGLAKIEVRRVESGNISFVSSWWYDD